MKTATQNRIRSKKQTTRSAFGIDARLISAATSDRSADRDSFLSGMRSAVTGVNIVTTEGPAGRFGLTVSAFSSVSADPPTVLVCINRRSPVNAAVRTNGRFCVNVLSAEQSDIADIFAGRPTTGAPYGFRAAQWNEDRKGLLSLIDAVATFDCTLDRAVESGSHTIFIGRVTDVSGSSGRPLIYTGSAYGRACSHSQPI